MDNMLFPENCESLVIVPSNKEGTGFLNHCYDDRFLKDYITEKEFNTVVLIASKLSARAYSKKKLLDKRGVGHRVKCLLLISTFMAITSIATILVSILDNNKNELLLYISHLLIAPALIAMFIIAINNWKRSVPKPITFNEMVKQDLDDFFAKINSLF